MQDIIAKAGFKLEQDRAFQILPLWGSRPVWLRPLLHPVWKRLMARQIKGRLLDEVICCRWPLRNFAFRHIMICRKL